MSDPSNSLAGMFTEMTELFEESLGITATLYPAEMGAFDVATEAQSLPEGIRPVDVWGIWAKSTNSRTARAGEISDVTEIRGKQRIFTISPNGKLAPGSEEETEVIVEPKIGDTLTIGLDSFSVDDVKPVQVGATVIHYRLFLVNA